MSKTIVSKGWVGDDDEVKSVELRLKTTEVFGVPLVFCFLGIVALVKPDIMRPNEGTFAWVLRVLGFLLFTGGIFAGQYLNNYRGIVADNKGIRWRVDQHKYEIEWDRIKSIQVKRKQSLKGHADYTNLFLTGLKDEQIGHLCLTYGIQEDRQKLIDFALQQIAKSGAA